MTENAGIRSGADLPEGPGLYMILRMSSEKPPPVSAWTVILVWISGEKRQDIEKPALSPEKKVQRKRVSAEKLR